MGSGYTKNYFSFTHYLIAYDITDSKRLNLVFALLKRFGYRKQNSLFEAELTKSQFIRLNKELRKIVDFDKDSILIYPLNKYNLFHRKLIGKNKFIKRFIV